MASADIELRKSMTAVIIGGCVNVFGYWFFVFPLGMGMTGAATATVLGTCVQVIIMCSHFFSKKCTLRIVKPNHVIPAIRQTLSIGFGASVLDLGTVILAIIMNNQIMKYGDTTALAVYGVVATIDELLLTTVCCITAPPDFNEETDEEIIPEFAVDC